MSRRRTVACACWDSFHQQQIYSLEKVQSQQARFAINDYRSREAETVTTMMNYLNLETLEEKRCRARAALFHKIVNHPISGLSDQSIFNKPYQTDLSKNKHVAAKFLPRTIVLWSNIPNTVRSLPALQSFKSALPSSCLLRENVSSSSLTWK